MVFIKKPRKIIVKIVKIIKIVNFWDPRIQARGSRGRPQGS